jgi:hypothetical protein
MACKVRSWTLKFTASQRVLDASSFAHSLANCSSIQAFFRNRPTFR